MPEALVFLRMPLTTGSRLRRIRFVLLCIGPDTIFADPDIPIRIGCVNSIGPRPEITHNPFVPSIILIESHGIRVPIRFMIIMTAGTGGGQPGCIFGFCQISQLAD